jgi:hypothetical protein
VRKHLAGAIAYLRESRLGYDRRVWDCIGELRLAEDESAETFPQLAVQIRRERLVIHRWACDPANAVVVGNSVVYKVYTGPDLPLEDLIDEATRMRIGLEDNAMKGVNSERRDS